MGTANVTLPDGKIARVTFDTPDQLDQVVTDLAKVHTADKGPDIAQRAGRHISEAIGEPVLQMATGAAGALAGGLKGIVKGYEAAGQSAVNDIMAGKPQDPAHARQAFADAGAQAIEETEKAFTRQPRTAVGQAAAGVVSAPFTLLAKGANKAGEVVAEQTGSPALGAAANTAIQSLPGALGKFAGAGREAATAGTVAEDLTATGAPRTPPSTVGEPQRAPAAPGAAPQEPLTATGAPRAPASTVGEGPAPPGTEPPLTENQVRARAYASRNGLDWSRLGAGTRKALETIAQDAAALDKLNPAALRRQAALQQLRIPVQATRGQLERDPVQLRREAVASNTAEGQPIRDVDIAANRDLQANLEVLRGRVGGRRGDIRQEPVDEEGNPVPGALRGPTKPPTRVGESTQSAAQAKAKWSKKGYEALYKIAEETDPHSLAGTKPVTDLLLENPDIQHVGWVKGWFDKARGAKAAKTGVDAKDVDLSQVTLKELYDLRKLATKNMAKGSTTAHFAGQVRDAVDAAMKDVPEGAKAWQRATDAFRKHQEEFKDQGAVRQLVSKKKGSSDPALDYEKTHGKIAAGPLAKVRQVKKTLLTGGTPELRAKGRAAWRDFRAETVNRILEDARNVTAADETERAVLTENALRKSISRFPRENLEEILGKANTRELFQILRARRITTRSPVGGRTTQSGTVPNALVLAEKVLKHIPYGGKYLVGAKHAISDLGARGEAVKTAQEATVSQVEQAARDVERVQAKRARRAAIDVLERGGGPGAGAPPQPLSIGDAVRRPPP